MMNYFLLLPVLVCVSVHKLLVLDLTVPLISFISIPFPYSDTSGLSC